MREEVQNNVASGRPNRHKNIQKDAGFLARVLEVVELWRRDNSRHESRTWPALEIEEPSRDRLFSRTNLSRREPSGYLSPLWELACLSEPGNVTSSVEVVVVPYFGLMYC